MREATAEQEPRDDVVYVTKTVASIVRGDGNLTAYEAAFLAIARDDDEGRYTFTIDGQQFIVTTERPETHTR